MLPNNGNVDDLMLDFEEDTEKTLTFGIRQVIDLSSQHASGILGTGVLSFLTLNIGELENKIEYVLSEKIDGIEALRQSIYLMLNTEADQYIIYPYTYGVNTLDLIGKPNYYAMAVLPDRLKETLLSDDRITDVSDFEFEVRKNKLFVKFIAHTIYGDVEGGTEVAY